MYFSLTEVNQICGQRITEYFIIDVDWSLWDCKEGALTDIVLEPEVVVVEDALKLEGILLWKQVACKRFVLTTLRRVHHL